MTLEPSNIEIVNPLEHPDWDNFIQTHPASDFFHSAGWARTLCESYNFRPFYFISRSKDKVDALIPVMEIKSPLTGCRGVSLPFSDFCLPIVSGNNCFRQVVNRMVELGRENTWKYFELRGGSGSLNSMIPSVKFINHTLQLLPDGNAMYGKFRDSNRRNISKAAKAGVSVLILTTLDALKAYYEMHCQTRKYHGLPPQPFYFFANIHKHIINAQKGFVALAFYGKRAVAGAIFFTLGKKALYKFSASDRRYLHLRPNNLIVWEAIRWLTQNGFKQLEFGRTEPENRGLLQFKNGWGAKNRLISYYKFDLRKNCFVEDSSRIKPLFKLTGKIPAPMLNLIGRLLYKHIE